MLFTKQNKIRGLSKRIGEIEIERKGMERKVSKNNWRLNNEVIVKCNESHLSVYYLFCNHKFD